MKGYTKRKVPVLTRFWRRVRIAHGCWNWQGTRPDGYGRMWANGRLQYAHKLLWEILNGPVPDGLELDHVCRNHSCVNPGHIEAVTHKVNILRGAGPLPAKAKQTHCVHGHAFTEENIYRYQGRRKCRTCIKNKKISTDISLDTL